MAIIGNIPYFQTNPFLENLSLSQVQLSLAPTQWESVAVHRPAESRSPGSLFQAWHLVIIPWPPIQPTSMPGGRISEASQQFTLLKLTASSKMKGMMGNSPNSLFQKFQNSDSPWKIAILHHFEWFKNLIFFHHATLPSCVSCYAGSPASWTRVLRWRAWMLGPKKGNSKAQHNGRFGWRGGVGQ